jgi:hypothetical protein
MRRDVHVTATHDRCVTMVLEVKMLIQSRLVLTKLTVMLSLTWHAKW